MIYGQTAFNIDKQRDQCRWIVTMPDGRELVGVPWRYAFDQRELLRTASPVGSSPPEKRGNQYYDKNKLAALEVCLLTSPLDQEDLDELYRRYPGILGTTLWRVVPSRLDWEVEPARSLSQILPPERERTARQATRQQYSAPAPECSTPRLEEESVTPDPERKLLV